MIPRPAVRPHRAGSLLILLLVSLWGERVSAHYLDIAQLSLYPAGDPLQFRLQVTLPLTLDPNLPVALPPACALAHRAQTRLSTAWRVDLAVRCQPDATGYLQTRWGRDGATLRQYSDDDAPVSRVLSGGAPGVRLPLPNPFLAVDDASDEPGWAITAIHYLHMGAVHVLVGWDHLAFVFCLTLLASGLSLVALVTAFTLGHSLSLALAHFGLIRLSISPVEAVIALSIVFMAREAWLRHVPVSSAPATSDRKRMLITGFFGLVHGLGFASVLGDLGVIASERVLALAFFNVGVEIGQIAFVLAVLTMALCLRRLSLERPVLQGLTAAVGGLGVFWTLQRVLLVTGAPG